jgi:hypothetical protein
VLQSLVTNTSRGSAPAAGQPVTVHLPSQSLRVLAATERPSPALVGSDGQP